MHNLDALSNYIAKIQASSQYREALADGFKDVILSPTVPFFKEFLQDLVSDKLLGNKWNRFKFHWKMHFGTLLNADATIKVLVAQHIGSEIAFVRFITTPKQGVINP